MIKHLPYLCNLALVLTLYLVLVALILQMAAKEVLICLSIHVY